MKVELRDLKTRDGAVCVDLDPTQPNDYDLAWLEKAGEVVCLVGLLAVAVLAMAVF